MVKDKGSIISWLFVVFVLPAVLSGAGAPAGLAPEKALHDLLIERWTTEEGLPSHALNDILYHSDGYLWIATYTGLVRFDGLGFEVFTKSETPGLGTDNFLALTQDADDGALWIATHGNGAVSYHNGSFRRLSREESGMIITVILSEGEDGFRVGMDAGLFERRGEELHPVELAGIPDVRIRDLLRGRGGDLWIATEGEGVVRWSGEEIEALTTASGLNSNSVTALHEAEDGVVWIGTMEGLSFLEKGRVASVEELTGFEISKLYGDNYGNLWIAATQGLVRRNARTGLFEVLESLDGIALRGLTGIAFDEEGGIWLTSTVSGLLYLREGRFRGFSQEEGLSTSRVNAVFEREPGSYLLGMDDGVIHTVIDSRIGTLDLHHPFPDLRIRDFFKDRRGHLWISSYVGVLEKDGDFERLYTTEDGLPSNQVRFVYEDRRSDLWIATRNAGLARRAGDGFEVLDHAAGLISDFVLGIGEDAEGNLLLAMRDGVSIVAPDGEITNYGSDQGFPGQSAFSVASDTQGALWISTNAGLSRLFGGKLETITWADGLPTNTIFDFFEDAHGQVWMSSPIGVLHVEKHRLDAFFENGEKLEIEVLNDEDGMVDRQCTGATKFLRASNGELWFPTLGGVAVLDPENQWKNTRPPPVAISGLTVDHQPIDLREEVELEPGSKRILFHFATLGFLMPARMQVRYRMLDYDDEWIEAGLQRSALYTSLPPGRHTFQVIAANNDGIWNREGATVDFVVQPYFHQTKIFYVLVLLGLFLTSWAVYRQRLRVIRKRTIQLERIVAKQRRAEAARIKLIAELEARNAEMERFTYTVSHDLKSPLFTIEGFIGMVEKDSASGDSKRILRSTTRIRNAVHRMGELLDDLLELSQIGRVAHPPEDVALGEIVGEVVEMMSEELREGGVELEISEDLPTVRGDRVRLREVVQNLMENAVKFSGQESPRIEIGVRREAEENVCFVRDNGIGVDPRYLEKIFGLFERLHPEREGSGIGLAIVRRVIEVHEGRIWVESEGIGRGATFCFVLPEVAESREIKSSSTELPRRKNSAAS